MKETMLYVCGVGTGHRELRHQTNMLVAKGAATIENKCSRKAKQQAVVWDTSIWQSKSVGRYIFL